MLSTALAAILCIQDPPWTDPLKLDISSDYYYNASPSDWDGTGPETDYDGYGGIIPLQEDETHAESYYEDFLNTAPVD